MHLSRATTAALLLVGACHACSEPAKERAPLVLNIEATSVTAVEAAQNDPGCGPLNEPTLRPVSYTIKLATDGKAAAVADPTTECTFQARANGMVVEAENQPCAFGDNSALTGRGFTGRTYDFFRFDESTLTLQMRITSTWTNDTSGPRKQCTVVASPDKKATTTRWKYEATFRTDRLTVDDPVCERVRIADSPSSGFIEWLPSAATATQGTIREIATGCRLPVQVDGQQLRVVDTDCTLDLVGVVNLGVTRRRYTALVIDKAAHTITYRIRTTWTKDGTPTDSCIEGEGKLSDPKGRL